MTTQGDRTALFTALGQLHDAILRVENAEPKYSYGSTQVNLPIEIADRLIAWTKEFVPVEKLAGNGIETEPHVTVKFGLAEENSSIVEAILSEVPPIEARLGLVSLFKTNSDFDVLILKVSSPDLRRVNRMIRERVRCVDTFPIYTPHVTLAYVKKGSCDDLEFSEAFDGTRLTFDTVWFSSRYGTMIPMTVGTGIN